MISKTEDVRDIIYEMNKSELWLYIVTYATLFQWWLGLILWLVYVFDGHSTSGTPEVLRAALFFLFAAFVSSVYCRSRLDAIKKIPRLFAVAKFLSGMTITIVVGVYMVHVFVPA